MQSHTGPSGTAPTAQFNLKRPYKTADGQLEIFREQKEKYSSTKTKIAGNND